MTDTVDLIPDLRSLPIGCREEAVLAILCAMDADRAIEVVSDADLHALERDLDLSYPGKFVVRRLPPAPRRHRAIIAKTDSTPPYRERWQSALASGWSAVRDP